LRAQARPFRAGLARRGPGVRDSLILRLRDQDGTGWAEIARQTGMSRTGVRKRYLTSHTPPGGGLDRG